MKTEKDTKKWGETAICAVSLEEKPWRSFIFKKKKYIEKKQAAKLVLEEGKIKKVMQSVFKNEKQSTVIKGLEWGFYFFFLFLQTWWYGVKEWRVKVIAGPLVRRPETLARSWNLLENPTDMRTSFIVSTVSALNSHSTLATA